ncbi:hypothetical protein EMCRGX_G016003 [Ephydatia muelleri]
MAAPSSVHHSLALVTRGVTLEPKSTFVVPRRAHRLKKTQIKADEAFALASAKLKPKENLLSELDCVSLADRVVNRAKERLDRRQKKQPISIFRPNGGETELRISVDRDKSTESPSELHSDTGSSSLWRRRADASEDCRGQRSKQMVFLSEAHSRSTGVLNAAPHVTPKAGDFKQRVFPSVQGGKSLKMLKSRLDRINAGVGMQTDAAHGTVKVEKDRRLADIKAQQRAEIYALNKYMTEFEEENFRTLMAGKV